MNPLRAAARALLIIPAAVTTTVAAACIWGWERPVQRAPVWVVGLILLVPLHPFPELLEYVTD